MSVPESMSNGRTMFSVDEDGEGGPIRSGRRRGGRGLRSCTGLIDIQAFLTSNDLREFWCSHSAVAILLD